MAHVATDSPGPVLVLGRAAVLGAVGFGSGTASHVAGGGRLPGGLALLCLLAVSVAVSAHLVRSWASTRRLVVAVLVAQSAWHLVLSLLAGHAGDPRGAPPAARTLVVDAAEGRRTGSLHDAYVATVPAPASTSGSGEGLVGHQLTHLGEQGLAMVLAHLAGALLLGLLLARGETTLRMLVGVLGGALGAVLLAGRLVPVHLAVPRPRAIACGAPAHRSARLARDSTRRRGPPVLLAA